MVFIILFLQSIMQISIIIPVYNGEAFIKKAVSSSLQQEEILEVLIIDDCSSDRTVIICEELVKENDKIKAFFLNKNKGPAGARNIGLKKAKGKYITFLDADDYYLEGRFVKSISIMEKSLDVHGVFSSVKNLGYEKYEKKYGQSEILKINSIVAPEKLFSYMVEDKNELFHLSSLIFRSEILKNVGYFDEQFLFSEDLDYLYRIALKYTLVSDDTSKPLIHRVVHGKNMTFDSRYVPETARFPLVKKWYNYMIKKGFDVNSNIYLLRRFLHLSAYERNKNFKPIIRMLYKVYILIQQVIKHPVILNRLVKSKSYRSSKDFF